jgi:hypothetical protein
MNGYDQWKTASPYDNDVDWGELGVACVCGCDAPEQQDDDGEQVELWCPDCGRKWKHRYREHIKDGIFSDKIEIDDLTT